MPSKQERMEALQAEMDKLAQEDDDDDYEIEIYSPEGHGARVPYRKGRGFLQQHFGIDADALPKPGDDDKTRKPTKAPSKSGNDESSASDSGETTPRSNLRFMKQSGQRQAQ